MEARTIRRIAGLLLLINGTLHIVTYLSNSSGSIGALLFGVAYFITGILLYNKKMYPLYLGLIVPIVGMTVSIIKFGIPELFSLSALFKLFGIIVVICCGYILIKREK